MLGTVRTTLPKLDLADPDSTVSGAALVQIHPMNLQQGPVSLGEMPVRIGRSHECDIEIDDASVSRKHALIRRDGDRYEIVDLGSTNGIRVNEEPVASTPLRSGDRIRVGAVVFRFLAPDDLEIRYHETVYAMMTRDGLTAAFNKRYLMESLGREVARCRRHQRPIALALLDIDHFKQINDTHGHLAGDDVLRQLAERLRGVLREDEMLARFGGEEFAIVMVELDSSAAVAAAERCRQAIEATPIPTAAGPIPVTISLGVAVPPAGWSGTAEQLIELADQRLYDAKSGGRNRVAS